MTRVHGLVGGPEAGGRTTTAVAGVLAGATDKGAETELLELSETALPAVVEAIDGVDAVVFGSPVYRATHSALLKACSRERNVASGARPALRCRARRQPSS
jgi:FMN reductase